MSKVPSQPKAIEMNESPPQTLTDKMVGETASSGVSTSDINILKKLMPGVAQDFEKFLDKSDQEVTDNSSDMIEGDEKKDSQVKDEKKAKQEDKADAKKSKAKQDKKDDKADQKELAKL